MDKLWPALDVYTEGQDDRGFYIADDFAPTAIQAIAGATRFFFSNSSHRDRAAEALLPYFRVSPVDIPGDDWARRSQENLTPITVGRITVAPPWHVDLAVARTDDEPPAFARMNDERASARPASAREHLEGAPARQASRPDSITVVINPSMGFGTGHHATTRLCLAALQKIDLTGALVLDFGTGSGVLAIAAVLLGAADAFGVDDDPDAVQAAVENLTLNPGLPHGRITFLVSDLLTMEVPAADVVTANLTGALLIRAAGRLQQALKPGGVLIMSGLQVSERDEVKRAFAGLEVVNEAEEDGWITFTARRLSND